MRYVVPILLSLFATPGVADIESSLGPLDVTPVVQNLDAPWAFGFLPSGEIIITEKDGRLLVANNGIVKEVSGLPVVADSGQGGLLDVLVPRDFETTREILFTFAKPQSRGSGTALGRGILSEDMSALIDVKTLFELKAGSRGGRHFGSRIAEGPDGMIYISIGDRGDRPSAQDLSRENGSIVRLNRDGTVPADNPFAGSAIWSYGHRNPQGLAFDAAGQLWGIEHGARGGDEVNLIRKSANYGWPVIAYGQHYSGGKIGEGTQKSGMEQPAFYWDPSIAPSGATFLSGRQFSEWDGHLVTGSLKFDSIHLLKSGSKAQEVEILKSPETLRVRDVRLGPQGGLWFLSVGQGALYRITRP